MLRFKQFLVEQEFLVEKTIFQTNFDGSGRTLIRGSTKNAISNYEPFAKAFGFSDEQTFVHIGYNGSVGSVEIDSSDIVVGSAEAFWDFKTKSLEIGTGKRYVSKIESDDGKIVVIASGSAGLSVFVAGAGGIKWNEATLETAGAIGLYMNVSNSDLTGVQPEKNIASEIMKVLEKNLDWKDNAKDMIYKKLSNFVNKQSGSISTGDMETLLSLANGMSKFRGAWLGEMGIKGELHFVHSKIPEYYKIETEAVMGSVKDNTTDLVVMNKPVDEFIKIITSSDTTLRGIENDAKTAGWCAAFDSDGIELTRWAQLSMKKSAGGAQLGKVTKFMKNKYGLDDFSTIFDSMLTPEDLNEGIVDVIKIGIKFAKNLFKALVTKLKALSKFMQKKSSRDISNLRKSQMDAWATALKRFNLVESLGEARTISGSDVNFKLVNLTDQEKKNIVTSLHQKLRKIYNLANESESTWISMGTYVDLSTNNFRNWKKDTPTKLLSNYCALLAMEKMLFNDSENIRTKESLMTEIANIYGDMFFGKTSLPLWKIFGTSDDSQKHSEYLGKYKDFVDKSKNKILEDSDLTEGLILMGITASKQKAEYYNIQSAMLWDIEPGGILDPLPKKKWVTNRMGTNHGDVTANWIFEGMKIIGEKLFKKNYVPKG